jgi:hypothetical protein
LALLVLAPGARTDFSASTLVSGTPRIQFDNADAPAISADGRYVVFQGSLAGAPGVYRRDIQTGQVDPVAVSDPAAPALSAPDAAAPSVSADGRYVAFTTTADLQPEGAPGKPEGEPAPDAGCPEVYLRDMSLAPGAPGAYALVSTLEGSDRGITFGGCAQANHSFAVAGAQAAPGVALGENAQHQVEVAFTVLSPSNLTRGEGCPQETPLAQCPPETPPSQVVVRDLNTKTTTLVSATANGQATPGGGAFPSSESEEHMHAAVANHGGALGDQITGSTAAISADASTIAWLGTNVPLQVANASDVGERGFAGFGESPPAFEVEPLWRRVADGASAKTVRLLAGAGLDFYLNIGQEGPAYDGSFVAIQEALFVAPAISADGRTVAVIANAPTPAGAEEFSLFTPQTWPNTDAYLVDLEGSADAPRASAITATPSYSAGPPATDSVIDLAISPDGTRVALDTSRSQFSLPALAFTSPSAIYTGATDTYEANLALGTFQRVSSTYDGSNPNGSAGLLGFSGDGQTLAFASLATNLFFGDSILSSQVYLVHERASGIAASGQEVGPAPAPSAPAPEWKLSAIARAEADGSVLIEAETPGKGTLAVHADAQLPSARAKRKGRRPGFATRQVAQAARTAAAAAQVKLRLRVGPHYRALLTRHLGLYAVLRVSFTAPHHRTLSQLIPVTFRARAHKLATHRAKR